MFGTLQKVIVEGVNGGQNDVKTSIQYSPFGRLVHIISLANGN